MVLGRSPEPARLPGAASGKPNGDPRVDPAAQIIFSGLFPFPTDGEGMKALKFLDKFYAAGGTRKTFDVLSLHPTRSGPQI